MSFADDDLEHLSPGMRSVVDEEIKSILEASYQRAKALLSSHVKELHLLASTLLERETMNRVDIESVVLRGKKLPPLM